MYLPGKAEMVRFGQGGAIRGPKRTRIPDFDRLVERTRNDRLSVWIEGHGGDQFAVRVLFRRLELESACQRRQKASVWVREGDFGANVPASQTLIVLSRDPDTIFVPSGEKATE